MSELYLEMAFVAIDKQDEQNNVMDNRVVIMRIANG